MAFALAPYLQAPRCLLVLLSQGMHSLAPNISLRNLCTMLLRDTCEAIPDFFWSF